MNDRLMLGTVQFGLKYGISNSAGQTTEEEVGRILEAAEQAGVRFLDTAYAYGSSEECLGHFAERLRDFRIVTKVPNLQLQDHPEPRHFLEESLRRLKRDAVYGLLFHNPMDLLSERGDGFYRALAEAKRDGLVSKIGVSAYSEEQLRSIVRDFDVDLVQVPINILDQRLVQSGCLQDLKQRGVEIHVRSVFLQGLLLMDPQSWAPYFDPVKPLVRDLQIKVRERGMSLLAILMGYVKAIPEVDKLVMGVNDLKQFNEVLTAYGQETKFDYSPYATHDDKILNPMKWTHK
jgi:aryl-alcohol dehydrogenase-like predicted oxidoreductase